ncbi:hypothetical protein [Desulfosporosinus sp. FKA]|uniref:hypothetical protein n=1 Tax=Desulfosporosinus sp. FKA TaxID=1969834 RepID=UPI000B4A4C07|nr:hypothetical protein [Desulfosporosinus sp. FKA]
MPKVRASEITAYFKSDVKTVWNVVTNNVDYKWRSDIKKIEVSSDGNHWLEYYNEKAYTKFALVEKVENNRYVFDMENKMFTGHWTGCFSPTEMGGAKVIFTEKILIKNPLIRIISNLFWDLEKIQRTYIADLKIKLQEDSNS